LTVFQARADQVSGSIAAIDTIGQQIMLDHGTILTLPKSEKAQSFRLGEKVRATYKKVGISDQALSIARIG
jgi:predicted RNA-binding protein (virulence factor B family)